MSLRSYSFKRLIKLSQSFYIGDQYLIMIRFFIIYNHLSFINKNSLFNASILNVISSRTRSKVPNFSNIRQKRYSFRDNFIVNLAMLPVLVLPTCLFVLSVYQLINLKINPTAYFEDLMNFRFYPHIFAEQRDFLY